MANLHPNRGRVVITMPGANPEDKPLPVAVQAAFGLGRVTVIGFDLDKSPFAEFPERADFWDWALRDCGANRASADEQDVEDDEHRDPAERHDREWRQGRCGCRFRSARATAYAVTP